MNRSERMIRLEPEWVLERHWRVNRFDGWREIIKRGLEDDSLEGCIKWWAQYQKIYNTVMGARHIAVENYRIRNTDTDEIIPCAAL